MENIISKLYKQQVQFFILGAFFILISCLAVFTDQYLFITVPFAVIIFYAGWQNKNLFFFLLLASLPFSFEYQFSSLLGTDVPDEFLMLFVAGLFFIYWIYKPNILPAKFLSHPLLLILYAGLIWTIMTVWFSTDTIVSVKYLLAKSWYLGAFVLAPLILFQDKKILTISGGILAAVAFFVVLLILIKQATTGFHFASVNEAVFPFFRNHVTYSAMLVCMLPVMAAFFIATSIRKYKKYIVVVMVISLIALFFSYARGAWLALAIGLLAFWLIKKKWLVYFYIMLIVFSTFFIFWVKDNDRYLNYRNDFNSTIFHSTFSEHLIATYKLKDVSTAERFYRWIAGVRMINDNWLMGTGPNSFYNNYKSYTLPVFKTWVSNNPDHSTVHNYFLLVAIEQGIPGLIFFILLAGAIIWYAQNLYHRNTLIVYKLTAITVGVIIMMIIVLNFLSDLIETDKIGSIFYLSLASLIVVDIHTRPGLDSSPDVQRISQTVTQ